MMAGTDLLCTRCGREGHRASSCKVKVPAVAGANQQPSYERWSPEEDAVLLTHYSSKGWRACSDMLGGVRSERAIYSRIRVLKTRAGAKLKVRPAPIAHLLPEPRPPGERHRRFMEADGGQNTTRPRVASVWDLAMEASS